MNRNQTFKGHKNLRKGRVSVPGQIYFITVACKNRENRFSDFTIACKTSRTISTQLTWMDASVLAWVLMPDHYHVLLQLGESACLQSVMKRANSVLAITTNRASLRSGPVWQHAYYDRALRDDEDIKSAARYLIANPLRAKLVADVRCYPFWDAIWLSGGTSDIV